MKLAVRKDASSNVPAGGFHYMLHPQAMAGDMGAAVYEQMGYIIIEVPDEVGTRLIAGAVEALKHQVQVACLAEHALRLK